MVVYTREKLERLLKIEFVRFCIVGGSGFVINLILLKALEHVGLSVWVAQPISAEVALGSNFILHHNWTYKSHRVKKSLTSLIVQFHVTSWPAIVGSTLMVGAGERLLHLSNLLALALSSVIVLMWNFVWTKFVIWRDVSPKDVEEIIK
jgi:putative flippase GtrA